MILLLSHAALALGFGLTLALVRPAQMDITPWPWLPSLVVRAPADATAARCRILRTCPEEVALATTVRLDWLQAMVLATSALTVLCAIAIAPAFWWSRRSATGAGTDPTSGSGAALAGAAVALVAAIGLVHSLGSSARLGVEWLMRYLDSYLPGGWLNAEEGVLSTSRVLLAYSNAGTERQEVDLVPLVPALGLLCLVLVLAINGARLYPRDAPLPDVAPSRTARQRRIAVMVHTMVATLRTSLLPVVLVAAVLWGLLIVAFISRLAGQPASARYQWLVVLVHLLAAMTAVVIVARGHLGPLRTIAASIADVLGFWPVRWHPWGGVSYRDPVCLSIASELARAGDRPCVLVGHSQGSVLAAWTVVHFAPSGPEGRRPYLVTAGSPLWSLYATFFPAQFHANFFLEVEPSTETWTNFWRETDPIATPVDGAENVLIDDPDEHGRLRGHGDYWIAEPVVAHVRDRVRS